MLAIELLEVIRNSHFSATDLQRYASQTGAGRGAIEKDYVISILLLLMAELPDFDEHKKAMIFKGGTCIKKIFYPLETRFSEDLDFSNLALGSCESLFKLVKSRLVGENLGVTSLIDVWKRFQDERGIDFQVDYLSLLGQQNHIVVNLSTSNAMKEPSWEHPYISPYFSDQKPSIRVMDKEEILAEKVRALLQRHKPRDVFDVWFLMEVKHFKLDKKLLNSKLKRSYEAAPIEKRQRAGRYIAKEVIYLMRESVTEKAWKTQLGGLLIRPPPDRRLVMQAVEGILSAIGDIEVA